MDKERARRVRQAIDARALADGTPPTVRHVCLACVDSLKMNGALRRWPMFAAQADALGVRAVFVFPLAIGAISVGVLEVSRDTPGWPAPENTTDALLFADAALMVILEPGYSATAAATGDGLLER
ncbi:hypothetical protein [Nonomuraea roseola]|uniref:GAF domain-containing protein n=1 Tax=Nonomuraea roseola TaxID=46179 RepID=A0ABV5PTE0_9ACTN